MDAIVIIFFLALMGPIVGSLIGVFKKPSTGFIYHLLSFAAGVMLSISFLQLIPVSIGLSSVWLAAFGIILGTFLMYFLDKIIPHIHSKPCEEKNSDLKKTAVYLIIGIFLHNFPEGMAIAAGLVVDFKISIAIALSIAIHDIPEAICTSAPYYYCTKKRLKSFLISASTALPTLAGFAIAFFLYKIIPKQLIGALIGATAGLMIYISGNDLIPESCKKVTKHRTIFSFAAGVVTVILSTLLQNPAVMWLS